MKDWILNLPLRTIKDVSEQKEVDPLLIASIVSVESNGQNYATRFENHYKWLVEPERYAIINSITKETEIQFQKTSFGLMQVMGANFRYLGFMGNLSEISARARLGLEYGVEHLTNLIDKYNSIEDAVSSYNQGNPRKDQNGVYQNQHYVDKVMEKWNFLKGV